MASFLGNKELVAMTIILLLLSILCRFITGIFLNSLIREAENMSITQNRLLKQCKVKFRNCYRLNDGVPNIPVFVDKFMGKIQIGRISVDGLSHLSGQLMLLAVLAAGLGACAAIIDGKTVGEILPFYLMSFLGLYLYFSVSGLVDLEGKKELLKVSLTDFLENHMAPRLAVLEESEWLAEGREWNREKAGSNQMVDGKSSDGKSSDSKRADRKSPDRKSLKPGTEKQSREEPFAKGRAALAEERVQAERAGLKEERRKVSGSEAAAAFAFVQEAETGADTDLTQDAAEEKSAAEKRMEEQVFSKTQEKELEELLKEFFA